MCVCDILLYSFIRIIKLFTKVKISNDFVPYNSKGFVSIWRGQQVSSPSLLPQHPCLKYLLMPLGSITQHLAQ